jgi:hypothetical protein
MAPEVIETCLAVARAEKPDRRLLASIVLVSDMLAGYSPREAAEWGREFLTTTIQQRTGSW